MLQVALDSREEKQGHATSLGSRRLLGPQQNLDRQYPQGPAWLEYNCDPATTPLLKTGATVGEVLRQQQTLQQPIADCNDAVQHHPANALQSCLRLAGV